MPFETSPLPEGTLVRADFPEGNVVGTICGHSGEVAGLGYMYIVKVIGKTGSMWLGKTGSMWLGYDYSCVYLPASSLTVEGEQS